MSAAQRVSRGFYWFGLVLAGAFFIPVVGMLGSQADVTFGEDIDGIGGKAGMRVAR